MYDKIHYKLKKKKKIKKKKKKKKIPELRPVPATDKLVNLRLVV